MNNKNEKLINKIIDDIYIRAIKVASIKDCEFKQACEIGNLKNEFWGKFDYFASLSYSEVGMLIQKLRNKQNKFCKIKSKVKAKYGEHSFYKSIMEDFRNPYVYVKSKESIDVFIKKHAPNTLNAEKAGIISQYQNTDTLLYLFEKLHTDTKYTIFLSYVYGECVYRNPKLLDNTLLKEFYHRHVGHFWKNNLSNNATVIEKDVFNYLIDYSMNLDGGMGWNGFSINFKELTYTIKYNKILNNKNKLKKSSIKTKGISSAVKDACKNSNGDVLVSVSLFEDNNAIKNITAILQKYRKKLYIEKDITLKTINTNDVFTLLLNSASGYSCAYCKQGNLLKARLKAWKSMAGLAGLDLKKGDKNIIEPLNKCKWFAIKPDTDWFCQIMEDTWLVCINEDKNLITMMCATDTD